jgi:hypothetical protein
LEFPCEKFTEWSKKDKRNIEALEWLKKTKKHKPKKNQSFYNKFQVGTLPARMEKGADYLLIFMVLVR